MERQSRPEDAETSPGGFRPLPPDGQNPVCQEEPQKTCGSVPLIETPDYLVGFVELDDLGWFWDRQQKQAVVKEVRRVAQTQDVIIVVFAHGWNHDSSETDGNVLKFRQVLGRLALLEGEAARVRCLTPRRVVGVYLGWRGKAFKRPGRMPATLYNWTSFFSRKATAHRAGAEDAAELLSDLEAIRTKANSRTGNDQHASRMVVIGHSFGTAVVMARSASEVSPFQPVLAVFASQGDGPNRVLFPIARRLTTFFKKHRRDQPSGFPEPAHFQGKAVRPAAGQFEPTISFLLCPKVEVRDGKSFRCTRNQPPTPAATEDGAIQWKQAVDQQLEKLRTARPLTTPFRRGERDDLPLSTSTLFRLRPGPMTPYPIISVDDRLIRTSPCGGPSGGEIVRPPAVFFHLRQAQFSAVGR
jgi:hypothetical protein